MVAIGIATYVIVFNLKRISELYQAGKRKLVNSMLNDSDWKELGDGLKKSSSDEDSSGPSEWWIIIYLLRVLFRKKWSEGGGGKGDGGTAVAAVPDGHETKDSTGSNHVRKSGESPTDPNDNMPKPPLSQERVGRTDGSKVEGENGNGTSKQNRTPPKWSWFHLSWSRVFPKHPEDKERDIEGQKASLNSETDTGKGKGGNTAGASVREEKEVEKGKGIEIV